MYNNFTFCLPVSSYRNKSITKRMKLIPKSYDSITNFLMLHLLTSRQYTILHNFNLLLLTKNNRCQVDILMRYILQNIINLSIRHLRFYPQIILTRLYPYRMSITLIIPSRVIAILENVIKIPKTILLSLHLRLRYIQHHHSFDQICVIYL